MERGEQRAGEDERMPKAEGDAAGLAEEYGRGESEKRDRRAGRKGSGTSTRGCQAEMCVADLADARPYYRRHRVCELHAKVPVAVVGGARQRFCQQCSRFHEISEFDGAKRSCRKRLSGHNERRRKSSAEPCTKPLSRKISGSSQLKEIACGQLDDLGSFQISVQENNGTYKHFQIG